MINNILYKYSMIAVNLMHILLIGPIMIYINFNRDSDLFKKMLIGISLMIPFIVSVPDIKKLYITYQFINFTHWTAILGYFLYVSYLFAFNKIVPEYIYIVSNCWCNCDFSSFI